MAVYSCRCWPPAGVELVEHLALSTGRSLDEVRVLQRVAEASQVQGLMRRVSQGGALSEQEVGFLKRVAAGLERPLAEAAETLRRGGKVPLVGSRLGEAGLRLEPGTAEHMAAAWVDYQFRHPNKSSRFSYAIDDTWRKQYETILKNKEKGGVFEQGVLKVSGQQKNRALMMPPPGSQAQGFIPDAVPRSPTPGELVWGQPYEFLIVGALFSACGGCDPAHEASSAALGRTGATWQGRGEVLSLRGELMRQRYLTTRIWLPPGVPTGAVIREFYRKVFEEYRWFRPVRYARAFLDKPLDPEHLDYDALVAYYVKYQDITVAARTDRDFFIIFPSISSDHLYTGGITWLTSTKEATKPAWRAAHRLQVLELMKLLNSPLALASEDEDLQGKTRRLVPNADGFGSTRIFTVRDYGEGLPGLFWRNFFGPLFVDMFGERLGSLPSEFKQELGDGIVLVQPYELPTLAGTPEAIARERQLIEHLGPECFYDHQHHRKPTRRPPLPPSPE